MSIPLEAMDGRIGKPKDCLFDDRHWTLRYLVADTGNWLPGKKVLISPLHLKKPQREGTWFGDRIPVELNRAQIEGCPELDEDAPVSRQYESEYATYYGHDSYWNGTGIWGPTHIPHYVPPTLSKEPSHSAEEAVQHAERVRKIEENPIRSAKEVIGYHIKAQGEDFGHVEDFLIDDNYWRIHYLVIDSRNWLPGRKFLVDIDWISDFSWRGKQATVDLTREQIESSPELESNSYHNKDYIDQLYDHYGKRREEKHELASR